MKRIVLTCICLIILYCSYNPGIPGDKVIPVEKASDELKAIVLAFSKRPTLDPFLLGLLDLEDIISTQGCKREIYLDKEEFESCKVAIIAVLAQSNEDDTAGSIALDVYRYFCRVDRKYLFHHGSLQGALNLCSLK